jgi:hypothetical protein
MSAKNKFSDGLDRKPGHRNQVPSSRRPIGADQSRLLLAELGQVFVYAMLRCLEEKVSVAFSASEPDTIA